MRKVYEERPSDLKPEPQHLLQHEFSVIVFLDYLCERPFDLIYQEKTIHQYQTRILNELVTARTEIRDSWVDNRIDDGITQILVRTQDAAKDHGFSQSIRRQSMKYNLPIMIGIFALSFVIIFFVGDLFPPDLYWLTYVVYMGLLLTVCFLPRVINQRLMKRWIRVAEEQGPIIKKYISSVAERFHIFIQFLIDDVRAVIAENDMDLANYRLMLFNPNYENVRVLQEQERRGIKFFIMELLPFDMESKPDEGLEEADYDEFGGPDL